MAKQLLQFCSSCSKWGLNVVCSHCGGSAKAAAPLKWSPEDQRAGIRRKINNVGTEEWLSSLPKI